MSERKILVWGLTNNRAGTEAIIKNYVQLCDSASFDFLCYEEQQIIVKYSKMGIIDTTFFRRRVEI